MSHFAVLVVGDDHEKQLAPFHEFECTGIDDEYVQDIDITEATRAEHATRSKGEPFTAAWIQAWNGLTISRPGAARSRDHKYGWIAVDEAADVIQVIDRTNPNAKWDWYEVGGRWTGFFKLKPQARGLVGRPGLMTEAAPPGYADQALKGDIDFEQMRNDAEVKARHLWRATRQITGGASWESWDDTLLRDPGEIEQARTEYHGQPAIELLKASAKEEYSWQIDGDLALDETTYIQRKRDLACVLFAFLRDGHWTERGKMGWFGAASDELSRPQWCSAWNRMLDALPDETLLTVVDCHI